MKKFNILFILILILSSFQSIPNNVFAKDDELNDVETNKAYIVAEEDEKIDVFEDEDGEIVKTSIPNDSFVHYTHFAEEDEFVHISYEDVETDEVIEGYIHQSFLRIDEPVNENVAEENNVEQEENKETDESVEKDVDEIDEEESTLQEEQAALNVAQLASSERLKGVALKSPTNVYEEKSVNANVLKDYRQGHILIFNTYEDEWYKATVYINGVAHTGYISAEDVDVINGDETRKEGQALVPSVSVYDRPSTEAKALKSYPYGQTLIYRTFSSKWHLATVIIDGERHTGYIHHKDVSPSVQGDSVGKRLSGVGLKIPTNVYSSMSKTSKVLKSYNQGRTLKYREYKPNWYIATVYVNGVAQTGYIHKDDVSSSNNSLKGIAQKAPTHVYSDKSQQASVLKSYSAGRQLIYRPYNNEWYSATVYINGKPHTGYIYHQDVGVSIPAMTNYALKQPTNIYASMSRGSHVLKSYKRGHLLKFKPHESSWYQAVVFVNGERKVGYIHHNDVGNILPGRTVVIDAGHGGKDPGTSGNGIVEKSLALNLSKLAQQMLEDAGVNVIMTRDTDEYLTLGERSRKANSSNADLFLSIHGNAFNGSASGIETYWYDRHSAAESERLAREIQTAVIRSTGGKSRGVKKGNFHVIRETTIPSALLEVGFVDHPGEAAKLKQKSYQRSLMQGVTDGILSFLK